MYKCCSNCNHMATAESDFPCCDCKIIDFGKPTKWEPVEERIATASSKPRNDSEKVNHPQHYNHGKYECIDVMVENFGKEAVQHFCLLNAFKYVWRSDYKNGIEDVKKAMWYLDKYLELESENHE